MKKVTVAGAAGRMGKRLISLVLESGDLELVGAVDLPGVPGMGEDAGVVAGSAPCGVKLSSDLTAAAQLADAVIYFANQGAVEAARIAVAANAGIVIGTTALTADDKAELQQLAQKGGRIVQAPNMSIGVNLLFHLCAEVASILDDSFDIEVIEMHHNQKKDAPSGTAVKLAEILCDARNLDYQSDVRHGRNGLTGARTKREIGMHSMRGGDVVGDHTVVFAANGERLELTHKASSRDTFASGALQAVRFLSTAAPGLYDMQDVLQLRNKA